MSNIFDPSRIKKPDAGKVCVDCGKKPAESLCTCVSPPRFKHDLCKGCFNTWAGQVIAVHRQFPKVG